MPRDSASLENSLAQSQTPLDRYRFKRDVVGPVLNHYQKELLARKANKEKGLPADYTSQALGVLSALLAYMWEEPKCWPSVETLMVDTGLSESSVKRGLEELSRRKVIRTQKRKQLTSIRFFTPDEFLKAHRDLLRIIKRGQGEPQERSQGTPEVEHRSEQVKEEVNNQERSQRTFKKKRVVKNSEHFLRNSTKEEQNKTAHRDLSWTGCEKHKKVEDGEEKYCDECIEISKQNKGF